MDLVLPELELSQNAGLIAIGKVKTFDFLAQSKITPLRRYYLILIATLDQGATIDSLRIGSRLEHSKRAILQIKFIKPFFRQACWRSIYEFLS